MYWWWQFYERYPSRVFFIGLAGLLFALGWMALPFFYGDVVFYPLDEQGFYQGSALFFPFIVAYLMIGVPYHVFEQRLHFSRLLEKAHVPLYARQAYEKRFVAFDKRRSIVIIIVSVLLVLGALYGENNLSLDNLTPAQELRRSGCIILPILMWALIFEGLLQIQRLTIVVHRLLKIQFYGRYLGRTHLRSLMRIFLNNALFVAFGATGVPMLWFGGKAPIEGLFYLAAIIILLAIALCLPIFSLMQQAWHYKAQVIGEEAGGEALPVVDADDLIDDAFLTRFFAFILRFFPAAFSHHKRSDLLIFILRFWAIIFFPLFIWAFALAAEEGLKRLW